MGRGGKWWTPEISRIITVYLTGESDNVKRKICASVNIMKESTAFFARHKARRIGNSCSRDLNAQGRSLKRQY